MSSVADKRYTNWVKDTLCLLYVKEGLDVFIDSQSANFHTQLKAALGTNTCPCSSPGLLARGKKGWTVLHCNGLCQDWLDRILSHHPSTNLRPPKLPNIAPGNVNAKLWPKDNWEVMKIFQPQGCQDQHSASDADIAALLDLMNNCNIFFRFFNNWHYLINEVMCVRNRLMHSSNFQVENSALTDDIHKMLTFLRSLTSLSATESQAVQMAIDKITQLQGKTLDLSLNRELELKAIQASQIALQTEMSNLKQTVTMDTAATRLNLTSVQAKVDTVTMDTAATRSDLTTVQAKVDTVTMDAAATRSDLTTVQAKVDTVTMDTAATRSDLTAVQAKVDTVTMDTAATRSDLTAVQAKVDTVTMDTAATRSDLTAVQAKVDTEVKDLHDKVQGAHDKTGTEVASLQCKMDTHVQNLQGNIDTGLQSLQDKIGTEVSALHNKIDTKVQDLQGNVDTKVQDLQGKVDKRVQDLQGQVDTKVQDLQGKVDTKVQDLQGKVDTKVQDLQGKVDTKVQDLQGKMDTKVQDLQGKVDTKVQDLQGKVDTQVHDLQGKVDTKVQDLQGKVDTKVQDLQDRVDTKLLDHQDKVEKEVSGLQSKVDREIQGLQQRLAAHMSRIQELQRELITQHQQSSGNTMFSLTGNTMFGLTNLQLQLNLLANDLKQVKDTQAAMNQSPQMDTKDIQDRLIRLYTKRCQKIPVFPLRPEWRTHVTSLFVLPSMKVTDPLGISKHHLMMGIDESSDIKVTSLKDIIPPAGSSCTDIYIMGDAGTGKSTLCEYLVHLWVSCHTSSHQAPDSEEKIMERFKFLFFISLREATSCNVVEMIQSQLKLKDVNVSRLLYDHSSLIILDGLDEYSLKQTSRTRFGSENVPYRDYSDKCTVLTTSRPWKLELLTRELEHVIDRQISIVGLETESQEKLVGKVADLLNSMKKHDKSPADFITEVQAQKLDKFLKTPVLLMQMLGLWFYGEPMGRSKCSIYAKLIDKQIQFAKEVRGYPSYPQFLWVAPNMSEVQHDDETMCTTHDLFSTFYKNYTYIMSNKILLQKVGRFAYCSLSSKDRESSLIFSHEQMELFDMSCEEILLCLHLGLLTQYKVLGEITQRLKSMSFIHKSLQEFFAAIYLSQRDQATELKQLLERDFTSLEHILEMGTVFMFVCGMNPTVAHDISRFITDKASGDARLEQYRQYGEDWFTTDPNTALVKQLQGLILAGIEEGRHNGHKVTGMQLQDLYMDVTEQDCPPARVLACTESLDLSHVKSLYIRDHGAISRDVLQQILQKTSTNLHKLVLWNTVVSVEMIQTVVKQNKGRLQTLALMNMGVDNVHISHLSQGELQAILSAPTNSLLLQGLVLTHSQLEFLCHHVSNSSNGEVWLGQLQCTTHGYRGNECKQRLDLSASRNLSRLVLGQLPVDEVRFMPENLVRCQIRHLREPVATSFISCLKRADKLEVLYCRGLRDSTEVDLWLHELPVGLKRFVPENLVGCQISPFPEHVGIFSIGCSGHSQISKKMDVSYCRRLGDSTEVELASTLPHLIHLQHIVFHDINLSGQQQIVRAVAQLKKLEYIGLISVTMREEELWELLAALPSSHRVEVQLGHSSGSLPVTITGYNRHTHLLEHIRHNPHIHVYCDEMEFEWDTCIVKQFWFNIKPRCS